MTASRSQGASRRAFLKFAGGTALAAPLAKPAIAQQVTVRWWYHFDNPQHSPLELVAKFEKENPGIKIEAQSIPWGGGNDYATRIFAAAVAGNPPDCALVRLAYLSRLLSMNALAPIDDYLKGWSGKSDIPDKLWNLNKGSDGKFYYVPLQYVVLYLYYRADLFAAANLQPPKTFAEFLNAAKTLTKGDIAGFGMRGGAGGHDHWGTFVLGGGASFDKGGMVTPAALEANRWFVALHREHKVFPASAPTDGFRQIVDGFKAGRTAMTIHHIGSANEMVGTLGDKVSAVPVPRSPSGSGWTSFADECNGIFAASKNKEAAFKWSAFLATAENNIAFNRMTGQLPSCSSAHSNWDVHPKRFVEATAASVPIASTLPDRPETADFTRTAWPTNMQRAMLGEITPDAMMQAIEKHFHG